ncbi:unnamed protein product, partial [marine sediment metagenome]
RLQETCGVVTGEIMVIGCKYFKRNDCPGWNVLNIIYAAALKFWHINY